ncbi:PPOX class F420-dependent oxidoreductase [Actinospongicola halichondriae]|uniref:PPOX class F420-dependent oxidoreductase n=1 Tax=Actinospongicola halichondriae TaxID=3236844 RepID=UPI003D373DC4
MAPDALRTLLDDRHHGVLVTLKKDGRPQLSNVAYVVGDDDVIRISVTDGRAKTANLRRDARASLHVTRDDFYAYTVVEGTASLMPVAASPDDETVEALVSYYREVAGEHDDWDEYRAAMVADRRLIIELPIERLYGMS